MNDLVKQDEALNVDLENFLSTTLQAYTDLRNIADPYYSFATFTSKWNEYDRCYEMRAKTAENSVGYNGWSNIVLPDFHDKIETLRVREMNTFFSGAELFETSARKTSSEEDASLGKKLVKYNFDCVELRSETSRIILDKYSYGTWVAYAPYTVDEYKTRAIRDEVLDEEGNPVEIDGVIQTGEPYKAYEIREQKYTDLQYINLKKVYVHPRIKDIQDQPAIFITKEQTYQDVIEMEAQEIIYPGEAEYIKDHSNERLDDSEVELSEDQKANDEELEDEVKVFDIYYGYFWWGEEDDRVLYEAIHMADGHIAGLKELPDGKLPFLAGQHIKTDGFYGIGAGDELYASFIAKCTRFNQVFDLSTFEIKGGGFKDANSLPNFKSITPGEYQDVIGLSAMLASKGKPMLSWADISGKAPSSTGLDVVQELDRAMQTGSGAVQLLSGMPTNSQVDKTASGIEATITEGNARINNYMEDFEDQMFKKYAKMCYENYQEHLDPNIDLPTILDEEDYTYFDQEGQKQMVKFPDVLKNIDIVFIAAKQILESEKTIGKIQRFMQIIGGIINVNPEFGQEVMRRVDLKYLTEEIARSLGIADLDKLFPQFNVAQELMDTTKELQQASAYADMMSQGIQAAMQQFEEQGDQAAINIVQGIMEEMQGGQDGQANMGAGQQEAPPAV